MSEPLSFATSKDWWDWLSSHQDGTEVWVLYYKKGSGVPSIDWEDAVVGALAHGWIDGVRKTVSDSTWMRRFTPRRPRSVWSARNVAHCERLIAEGRMAPRGLAEVEASRADGRWQAAYQGGKAELPEDFLAAVAASPKAAETLARLDARNRFAIHYRLTAVKRPETWARKVAEFFAMLERGEGPYGSIRS